MLKRVSAGYDVLEKFGQHERNVRFAEGVTLSSSVLSKLP